MQLAFNPTESTLDNTSATLNVGISKAFTLDSTNVSTPFDANFQTSAKSVGIQTNITSVSATTVAYYAGGGVEFKAVVLKVISPEPTAAPTGTPAPTGCGDRLEFCHLYEHMCATYWCDTCVGAHICDMTCGACWKPSQQPTHLPTPPPTTPEPSQSPTHVPTITASPTTTTSAPSGVPFPSPTSLPSTSFPTLLPTVNCERGWFVNSANACQLCQSGRWSNASEPSPRECTECTLGKISPKVGRRKPCEKCPVARYSNPARDFCRSCAPGEFLFNQTGCISCAVGRYA